MTILFVLKRMMKEFAGALGVCVFLSLVLFMSWDPVLGVVERLINASGELNVLLTQWRDSLKYLWVYVYGSLFLSLAYTVGVGVMVFRHSVLEKDGRGRPPENRVGEEKMRSERTEDH